MLWQQREDGTRGPVIARGTMQHVASHLRAMSVVRFRDDHHPLGVYYVNARKEIFVVDFVMADSEWPTA